MATTGVLFLLAFVNLFTKKAATISGVTFSIIFFILFTWSERKYAAEQAATKIKGNPHPEDPFQETSQELFQMKSGEGISPDVLCIKPGCILVDVSSTDDLRALDKVLSVDLPAEHEVVVLCVHSVPKEKESEKIPPEEVVEVRETDIFSVVVFAAEKIGKPVKLLAVAGTDRVSALLETAKDLEASQVWLALSSGTTLSQQESILRSAWETMERPRNQFKTLIVEDVSNAPREVSLT